MTENFTDFFAAHQDELAKLAESPQFQNMAAALLTTFPDFRTDLMNDTEPQDEDN